MPDGRQVGTQLRRGAALAALWLLPVVASSARAEPEITVPSVWVYAANDAFFAPVLSRRMFDAYSRAGAKAEYLAPRPSAVMATGYSPPPTVVRCGSRRSTSSWRRSGISPAANAARTAVD